MDHEQPGQRGVEAFDEHAGRKGSQRTPAPAADHEAGGMSRRQALGYAGLATVGLAGAGALPAETAAAATGGMSLATISLAQAELVLAAAVSHVRENKLPPMYLIVVDVCGDEKASRRMDGNSRAALGLVPPKARTALSFRTATLALGAATTDPGRIASFTAAGFSLLGGGVPLTVHGQVIGAIGVGGGSPEQDDEVAKAGAAAL